MLFCLASAFPLLSRGESGGLASDGVSLLFLLPFPLPLPRPFLFLFLWGGRLLVVGSWCHKSKIEGAEGPGGVRLREEDSAGRRGRTLRAGIGLEVPGASEALAGSGVLEVWNCIVD